MRVWFVAVVLNNNFPVRSVSAPITRHGLGGSPKDHQKKGASGPDRDAFHDRLALFHEPFLETVLFAHVGL